MTENMYYAAYDISNNRTREKLIRTLKDAGFERIQKSIFCGKISSQQKKDLLEKIKQKMEPKDSFYLILTCENCFGKIKTIGQAFDKEYVSGEKKFDIL